MSEETVAQFEERVARTRLGHWLAAEQNRTWMASLGITGSVVTVKLFANSLTFYMMASCGVNKTVEADAPTLAEAINAALDKAKP